MLKWIAEDTHSNEKYCRVNTPEMTMRWELVLQTPRSKPLPPSALALLRALSHSFLLSTCCLISLLIIYLLQLLLVPLTVDLTLFPSPSITNLIFKHDLQPLWSLLWEPCKHKYYVKRRSFIEAFIDAHFPRHTTQCPGKQQGQVGPGQGERVL